MGGEPDTPICVLQIQLGQEHSTPPPPVALGIPHPMPDALQHWESELWGFAGVAGVDLSRIQDGTALPLIFISEEHAGSGGSGR